MQISLVTGASKNAQATPLIIMTDLLPSLLPSTVAARLTGALNASSGGVVGNRPLFVALIHLLGHRPTPDIDTPAITFAYVDPPCREDLDPSRLGLFSGVFFLHLLPLAYPTTLSLALPTSLGSSSTPAMSSHAFTASSTSAFPSHLPCSLHVFALFRKLSL